MTVESEELSEVEESEEMVAVVEEEEDGKSEEHEGGKEDEDCLLVAVGLLEGLAFVFERIVGARERVESREGFAIEAVEGTVGDG